MTQKQCFELSSKGQVVLQGSSRVTPEMTCVSTAVKAGP